jgi:hypothetical protein
MKITVEFEKGDFNRMHDALYDLTGNSFTDEELEKLFNQLPHHVKGIAYTWGMSDTEFGGAVYEYFEKEMIKNLLKAWEGEE